MINAKQINKFKNSENFSVAGWFLPKQCREAILTLYKFARYCDEIADDNIKTSEQKTTELTEIYNAIKNNNTDCLPEFLQSIFTPINNNVFSKKHLLNLLEAFIQDCTKSRYYSFDETLEYCQKSAATIGKMFLEANNEFEANTEYADKICIVLQLLNHLQDIKPDYQNLNRLYFDRALIGDETELNYSLETKNIKQAKLKILGVLKKHLDDSSEILNQIKSIKVRLELATIINAAYALINRLEKKDIIRKKVRLKKRHKISVLLKSLPQIFNWKGNLLKIKSLKTCFQSSSFLLPMLSLNGAKRQLMLAFYQFCKQLDDCADKNKNEHVLNFWQSEITKINSEKAEIYPKSCITKQLAVLVNNQNISKYYFDEMIEGQKMDLRGEMLMPSIEKLDLYCFRVASCVGIISAKIFGYEPENENKINEFAEHLGKYFQYINILRDFDEDLKNNRIYLPSEILQQFNVFDIKIAKQAVIPAKAGIQKNFLALDSGFRRNDESRNLKPIFQTIAEVAISHRAEAFAALPESEKQNMRPALLMEKIYSKYFDMMLTKNFEFNRVEIKLSLLQKLYTVLK